MTIAVGWSESSPKNASPPKINVQLPTDVLFITAYSSFLIHISCKYPYVIEVDFYGSEFIIQRTFFVIVSVQTSF